MNGEAQTLAHAHHASLLAEPPGGPPGSEPEIAWSYLLPRHQIRRCVETHEIYTVRLGRRVIDIDVKLPESIAKEKACFVPVAYLTKDPLAPDLEVRNGAGDQLPAPTMRENMTITHAALALLAAEQGIPFEGPFALVARDVIFDSDPYSARIWALVAAEVAAPEQAILLELLKMLEDHFLLWVPLAKESSGDHRLSISRRAPRDLHPILPRTEQLFKGRFDSAAGAVDIESFKETGPRRPDFNQILERLLIAFGLRSVDIETELTDTQRFSSFHHCVRAPRGLVVRDIRVGIPRPGKEEEKEQLEELGKEDGLLIQGHDSEVAHVHVSTEKGLTPLVVRTTLGIDANLTTLWVLVVVLNAALLWLFDQHSPSPYLPEKSPQGSLEVAAATLLLVPTLAAAFAIRADEGAATRLMVSGTRALLLLSGGLSVAAALTLAGALPDKFGDVIGVKAYATVGYFAAVVLAVGWIVTLRLTWYVYRHWLVQPHRRFRATAALAAAAAVVVVLAGFDRPYSIIAAFCLIAIGLALAANAANRIRFGFGDGRGSAPLLASLGSAVAFVAAGYWLGYYDDVIPAQTLQLGALSVEVVVAGAACRGAELAQLLPSGSPSKSP